jgi:hypothetical protein
MAERRLLADQGETSKPIFTGLLLEPRRRIFRANVISESSRIRPLRPYTTQIHLREFKDIQKSEYRMGQTDVDDP